MIATQCSKEEEDNAPPKSSDITVKKIEPNPLKAESRFYTWKELAIDPLDTNYEKTIKYGAANVYLFRSPFSSITDSNFSKVDVFCEGQKLTNELVYVSKENIDFDQDVEWKFYDSQRNSTWAFIEKSGFPYMSKIISKDTLIKNQDYTLNWDTITNADSIIIKFFGIDTTVSGKTTSVTFRKEDIVFPGTPPGATWYHDVIFMPFAHSAYLINGKNFYFQNNFVRHLPMWSKG